VIDDKQVLQLLQALISRTDNGSMRWAKEGGLSNERHYVIALKSGLLSFRFFSPEMERDHVRVEIVNPSNYFVARLTIWDNDPGWGTALPLLEAIEDQLGRPQATLNAMLEEVRSVAAQ
jgi:hypothetical protein